MFCPNCGSRQEDGSRFCGACGTPLSAPQEPAYQQPVYQQPVYQQPVYQQPVYQQPVKQAPKKKKSALPVVIIALVLVAAIGAGLWFFVFNAKQTVYLLKSRETRNYAGTMTNKNACAYKYDENGNVLNYERSTKIDYEGDLYDTSANVEISYEYDKKGNIIAAEVETAELSLELEYIYADGVLKEVVGEGDDIEVEASCNKNGLIESIAVRDDAYTEEYTFEYDKDGNLEERTFKDGYMKTVCTYENGRMVEIKTSSGEEILDHSTYGFDDKGNMISQKTYSGGELVISLSAETTYDEDNMLSALEYKAENSDGEKINYDCEVERDDLEVTVTITTDAEEGEMIIELEYDEHGNLLEMRYTVNGETFMEWSGEYVEMKVSKNYKQFSDTDPVYFAELFE